MNWAKHINKSQDPSKPTVCVCYIIDRSGSMRGQNKQVIDGFNEQLQDMLKDTTCNYQVSTVLFDDEYKLLHDNLPLSSVKPMTDGDFVPRGMTALLDAVGKTIQTVPSDVTRCMMIIITDGGENSSKEYNKDQIRKLIDEKQKTGWAFVFLGANQDSWATAGGLNINTSNAVNYYDSHTIGGLRASGHARMKYASNVARGVTGSALNEDLFKGLDHSVLTSETDKK